MTKNVLLILLVFVAGSLSAQTEYWKISLEIDMKESREMKESRKLTGVDKRDAPSAIVTEMYLSPGHYSSLTHMGLEGMYQRTIVDSAAGRKLVLNAFGDMKLYKLSDLDGNELDESGAVIGKIKQWDDSEEPVSDNRENEDFTLTGQTKELMGMTAYMIRFISEEEEPGSEMEGWIVFGKCPHVVMPCIMADGRVAALVEMTVETKEGGMSLRVLEHRANAEPGPAEFSVSIPEGYERDIPFSELYGGYDENDGEEEVLYYFDPEEYEEHLVPAASYPDVTADYWKIRMLDDRGKVFQVHELYTVPGKYRYEYTFDGDIESAIVADSGIYWQTEIEYRDENFYVSRLESYYDSPANTNGEEKPGDFYKYAFQIPDNVWREGVDFHLLPDTRDAGGVTLLHVQLEQMEQGEVKGDGWLILRRLPMEEFSTDEFLLNDGRKGYLVECDYTYAKDVEFYGGDRQRIQLVHEPAKKVSGKLFSLAPPKGFEDYRETYTVWKAPDTGEETISEEEEEPEHTKEDYAPYLEPATSDEQVKADYWLIRDTDNFGREEYESWSVPGKFRSTHINYMQSSHTTLILDSTVHWKNDVNHIEKDFSFHRLESFYDSPANTKKKQKPDYYTLLRDMGYKEEGVDFTLLPDTKELDGLTLLHVRINPTFMNFTGDGWMILQNVPALRYDDPLKLSDGRIGYLLEYDLHQTHSRPGETPQWLKRQIIRHETGKMVDGKLFSLAPPKGYADSSE